MKTLHEPSPAPLAAHAELRTSASWASRFSVLLLTLPLAGCLSVHTRSVSKTVVATNVMSATLAQLVERMDAQYAAVQTLNASVDIAASTGGQHEGEVKEIPTFAGYLFLRKPADLHVLLLVPVLRSRALDMVSDGKTFKLLIPPKNRAVTGADGTVDPTEPSARVVPASTTSLGTTPAHSPNSGLETLRPNIIREALLVPAVGPDEYIELTEDARVLPAGPGHKDTVEEPDYDVTILRKREGQVLERVRVVHIGRITLKPYQQDIYDRRGRIVTRVFYDRYQTFGEVDFPMSILITRPLDEYTLKLEVTKLQVNGKLDDEQFTLKIPDTVPVQKM